MAAGMETSRGSPSLRVALAGTGLLVAAAAVALPALRFLRAPEVTSLATGLVVMACGLWAMRIRVPGWAPGLVFGAGLAWFLPDLAATGVDSFDAILGRLALLHVGLMTHALMLRTVRHGVVRSTVVVLGYACAAAGFVGGHRVLVAATGSALALVGLATRTDRVTGVATSAARLTFGLGLLVPQGAFVLTGSPATPWGAGLHEATFAASAALLTYSMAAVEVRSDPIDDLDRTLSRELGTRVSLVLSDGAGGWLDAFGRAVPRPPARGTTILDADGAEVARLVGSTARLDHRVVRTVGLAATNARLRHDVLHQVEQLERSRARVVDAAEDDRRVVLTALRQAILEPLAEVEQELRGVAGLAEPADRAAATRRGLQRFVETVDPFLPEETLAGALGRMAAPPSVVVRECIEPVDPSVRRAAWFCCAEGVANARKHAPGGSVELSVSPTPGGVVVRITDDGPGGADVSGGGLTGLRGRVQALGGTLEVLSGSAGTVVQAWLPDLRLVVDHDVPPRAPPYRGESRQQGSLP